MNFKIHFLDTNAFSSHFSNDLELSVLFCNSYLMVLDLNFRDVPGKKKKEKRRVPVATHLRVCWSSIH